MARQYLLPTGAFVNDDDTTTRTHLLPTGQYLTSTAAGGGVVEGTGSAVGTSTVAALATAIAIGVASATGVGTATAGGVTIKQAQFLPDLGDSFNGIAVVTGISGTVLPSNGASVGVGTAAANSVTIKVSIADSDGIAIVTGISEAGIVPTEGTGVAAGTSVVTGIGEIAPAPTEGTGAAVGIGTATAIGQSIVLAVASAIGTSTVNGIPSLENYVEGVAVATGTATADGLSQVFNSAVAHAAGLADSDFITGVVAGSIFNASGTATVLGQSPPSLVPGTFKPIEQRRIRMPKLPRGGPPEQWIDVSTREFDSFFNDMHHYLAANTFVSGVHTEILEESFTLTPETSTIFLMANEPVSSDPVTAIKNVTNVPRIFIVVNTSLFPITFRDGANTVFAGGDVVLNSGRLMFLVYTGAAWVGNAL